MKEAFISSDSSCTTILYFFISCCSLTWLSADGAMSGQVYLLNRLAGVLDRASLQLRPKCGLTSYPMVALHPSLSCPLLSGPLNWFICLIAGDLVRRQEAGPHLHWLPHKLSASHIFPFSANIPSPLLFGSLVYQPRRIPYFLSIPFQTCLVPPTRRNRPAPLPSHKVKSCPESLQESIKDAGHEDKGYATAFSHVSLFAFVHYP